MSETVIVKIKTLPPSPCFAWENQGPHGYLIPFYSYKIMFGFLECMFLDETLAQKKGE